VVISNFLPFQPVYLKTTSALSIPRLERIIVSDGRFAVMAPSVEAAYEEVQGHIRKMPTAEHPPG